MLLHLHRTKLTDKFTLGYLDADGQFFCYTVEDAVRDNTPGTAIPSGEYPLELAPSGRAARGELWTPVPGVLPLVLGVPGRSGIRIHAGNTAADVVGCVVVGFQRTPEGVGESRAALTALVRGLFNSLRCNKLVITEEPA